MTTGNPFPRLRLRTLFISSALLAGTLALPPAALPSTPAGETADETFYESVDVDVVNVEVVATDRSGHPVAGLDQGAFELYEDGKPVAITNFFSSAETAVSAPPAAGPPAAGQPASGRPAGGTSLAPATAASKPDDQILNFAVFVDNEDLTATARRPVLAALQTFFKSHVTPGDHVILASYNGGVQVSQPAAADPAALAAAVGKLMTGVTHGSAAIAEARRSQAALENGYESQFSAPSAGRQSASNALIADSEKVDLEANGNARLQSGRLTLAALGDFISSLAGLPGRKALLVVSGAFAVENGEPLLNRLAERANANRVTIYVLGAVEASGAAAVDPEARNPSATNASLDQGPSGGSSPLANTPFAAADALTGALHGLADRTGGLTAANLINPASFFETVERDVSTFYSLGFSPSHKHDGKIHRLAVKVKSRRDLNLRYRDTYEDRSGDQRTAAETLSALVLGVGENPLGVELSFEPPLASGKEPATVPVIVHVPVAKLVLIPQERFHEGRLTLFVATRNARGHVSSLRRLAAPVHVANDKLMGALGDSVAFRVEVAVPSGVETIAVGVRDEVGHVDSTAAVPWRPTQTAARSGSPIPRPPGR